MIEAVRSRLPDAPMFALTLNPNDTTVRHGIPALTCSGFSRPYYGVAEDGPVLASRSDVESDARGLPKRWRAQYRRALALPLAIWSGARALPFEVRHRRRMAAPTGQLRLIVVAGGGQIDDFWGGPFGHPYVRGRWARRARSTGATFAVLSVGTGSLTTRLARVFAEGALSLANYRSFRDDGSRGLLRNPLFASDPVVPDLAFAFPVERFLVSTPLVGDRPVIGISPIAYGDERGWPTPDEDKYRSYLKRLAALAAGLLSTGHDLMLFGTDTPDLLSVQDLKAEITSLASGADMARVHVPLVRNLPQLFDALAGVHAVVASRLHGVLLAQLAAIPVLALSYERKVETHMRALMHERFCLPIDGFDAATASALLSLLSEKRDEISSEIRRAVAERRREVELQYDAVLCPLRTKPAGEVDP